MSAASTSVVQAELLVSLFHVIDYGVGFNECNVALGHCQDEVFSSYGKDILSMRDPITVYERANTDLQQICALLGAHDMKQLKGMLRQPPSHDVSVPDLNWLVEASNEAITRYRERTRYFMLENEYRADLVTTLGETGAEVFSSVIHDFLNDHLVCGNADRSIRALYDWLQSVGHPYTPPPPPYGEKHDARFADMQARLAEFVKKRQGEPTIDSSPNE
jgi:hypothetical protein